MAYLNFHPEQTKKQNGSLSSKILRRGIYGGSQHERAAATIAAYSLMDSPDSYWNSINWKILHRLSEWCKYS